jgi:5-methylphenazine-1-carboxylate 1-monooxygenase
MIVAGAGIGGLTAALSLHADGVYSGVRAQLHPGEPPPCWSGILMWPGVVEGAPFLSGRTVAVAGTNAALKFVAYPISRQAELRGRALINWVAEVMVPGGSATAADWNRHGRVEDVLSAAQLSRVRPGLPVNHAAGRGRAQLPSLAHAVRGCFLSWPGS